MARQRSGPTYGDLGRLEELVHHGPRKFMLR
jgi:hypothetical protein